MCATPIPTSQYSNTGKNELQPYLEHGLKMNRAGKSFFLFFVLFSFVALLSEFFMSHCLPFGPFLASRRTLTRLGYEHKTL